jgi:hypothetical protein
LAGRYAPIQSRLGLTTKLVVVIPLADGRLAIALVWDTYRLDTNCLDTNSWGETARKPAPAPSRGPQTSAPPTSAAPGPSPLTTTRPEAGRTRTGQPGPFPAWGPCTLENMCPLIVHLAHASAAFSGCPSYEQPCRRVPLIGLRPDYSAVLLAGPEPHSQTVVVTAHRTQSDDDLVQEHVDLTPVVAATKRRRARNTCGGHPRGGNAMRHLGHVGPGAATA